MAEPRHAESIARISGEQRQVGAKKTGKHEPRKRNRRRRILRMIALSLLAFVLSLSTIPVLGKGLPTTGAPTGTQAIDPQNRDFWNGKYNDSHIRFNHQPSRLLLDAIRHRTPGLALDLGMGEGRNAIYLAQQGWHVTGVDLSDVAIAQAKAHAAKIGVKVDAVIDGLDHFDFGQERWDLIILFYMHAWYNEVKPHSVQRLHDALKPGGLLVIEGFAGNEKWTFQPNELLRDFADLRILRYEDLQDEADWAPGRKSHIIRLVAEKAK
jgi:SAM-dependent methyltransferase